MPTPRRALLVGATALLVGGIAWIALPSTVEPTSAVRCPYPRTTAMSPMSTVDNAIRVVEKGFSQDGRGAMLGAVLENTSGKVAYRTLIRFHTFTLGGGSASFPGQSQLVQEIPVILPGRRIGAGTYSYHAETTWWGARTTVARFELEIVTTHWLPDGSFAPVTASDLRPRRTDSIEPGRAIIDYTVTSGYCTTLEPRGMAVVYRDSSGGVIGGSLEFAQSTGKRKCSPGRYDEWVGVTQPVETDDSRTEIYPYCDTAPKGVATDLKPFN